MSGRVGSSSAGVGPVGQADDGNMWQTKNADINR